MERNLITCPGVSAGFLLNIKTLKSSGSQIGQILTVLKANDRIGPYENFLLVNILCKTQQY